MSVVVTRSPLLGRTEVVTEVCGHIADGGSVLLVAPPGMGVSRVVAEVLRQPSLRGVPLLATGPLHDADPHEVARAARVLRAGDARVLASQRLDRDLPPSIEDAVVEGLLTRIVLPPLDAASGVALAAATAAPVVLETHLLQRIQHLAAGSPLVIRLLSSRVARDGAAALDDPTMLDALVGRRVLSLAPGTRRVMDLVAVVEPVPQDLLFAWRDEVHVLRGLGLVVRDHRGDLRVDHPLRRDWLLTELGRNAPQVLGDFLDRLDVDTPGVDPLRLVVWQAAAAREVDAAHLLRAARISLLRGDGTAALRLLGGLEGTQADIVRLQALVTVGREVEAMTLLDGVLQEEGQPDGELALWTVRYLGLHRDERERVERILAPLHETPGPDTPGVLFRCMSWLWAFRGMPEHPDLDLGRITLGRATDPELRCEVAAGLALAQLQRQGAVPVAEGPARLQVLRSEVPGSPSAFRAQTVEAWCAMVGGDGDAAVGHVLEARDVLRHQADPEGEDWLGGAGGLLLAVAGRPHQAAELSRPPRRSGRTAWFRLSELREVTHLGNRSYLGPPPDLASLPPVLVGTEVEPFPLLAARARSLATERRLGHPDSGSLRLGLERSVVCRHRAYVAVVGLECVDLRCDRDVLELLRDEVPPAGGGLFDLVRTASVARLAGDAAALLIVAHDLERAGARTPALRALGDVSRLADVHEAEGRAARADLVRMLSDWDGLDPWWCPDLPSRRQRQVAWEISAGRSVADLAQHLYLSRRTVENHLQHVYAHLGVHTRRELSAALSPPSRAR